MINEFVAKKIGEVLAFTIVGNNTIEKGGKNLADKLGEETVADIREKNELHGTELRRIAEEAGMAAVTLGKAEKTQEKLEVMREVYIGTSWDNPVEVCEWSGFFEGAAIVHWQLLRGVAQALNHETLLMLTEEGVTYHYELLEKFGGELEETGQTRAVN